MVKKWFAEEALALFVSIRENSKIEFTSVMRVHFDTLKTYTKSSVYFFLNHVSRYLTAHQMYLI